MADDQARETASDLTRSRHQHCTAYRPAPAQCPCTGRVCVFGDCAPMEGRRLAACLPKCGCEPCLRGGRPLSHPMGKRKSGLPPLRQQPGQAGDQTKTKTKCKCKCKSQDQGQRARSRATVNVKGHGQGPRNLLASMRAALAHWPVMSHDPPAPSGPGPAHLPGQPVPARPVRPRAAPSSAAAPSRGHRHRVPDRRLPSRGWRECRAR